MTRREPPVAEATEPLPPTPGWLVGGRSLAFNALGSALGTIGLASITWLVRKAFPHLETAPVAVPWVLVFILLLTALAAVSRGRRQERLLAEAHRRNEGLAAELAEAGRTLGPEAQRWASEREHLDELDDPIARTVADAALFEPLRLMDSQATWIPLDGARPLIFHGQDASLRATVRFWKVWSGQVEEVKAVPTANTKFLSVHSCPPEFWFTKEGEAILEAQKKLTKNKHPVQRIIFGKYSHTAITPDGEGRETYDALVRILEHQEHKERKLYLYYLHIPDSFEEWTFVDDRKSSLAWDLGARGQIRRSIYYPERYFESDDGNRAGRVQEWNKIIRIFECCYGIDDGGSILPYRKPIQTLGELNRLPNLVVIPTMDD